MEVRLKQGSQYFLLFIIAIFVAIVIYLARSLITSLFGAILLAVILDPLFKKLVNITNRPKLSSVITVLGLCVLVVIPLIFVMIGLISQGVDMYNTVKEIPDHSGVDRITQSVSNFIKVLGVNLDSNTIQAFLDKTYSKIQSGFWNIIQFLMDTFVQSIIETIFALIFLYYFLINGKKLYKVVETFLPINFENKILLAKETYKNIQVLFFGQGVVALIQGLVGFVGFLIFGVPNALFWGFIMSILSFLPVLGAYFVWVPIGILGLMTGDYVMGWGVLIWGFLIVSNIDNVMRPIFISSVSKMNFLVILVGVYIGVVAFGLIGVVLGPLLITVTLTFIRIYYLEHIADREIAKD